MKDTGLKIKIDMRKKDIILCVCKISYNTARMIWKGNLFLGTLGPAENKNYNRTDTGTVIMADQEDCISRFFSEDRINISTNNHLIIPSESEDLESSQNLSQCSMESCTEDLSLSQLTIEEQEPIHIKPFFNLTPREMPMSPHYVFEEEFAANPWAMLVVTIFLTKTSGKLARPHIKSFFDDYPTPYHVLSDNPSSLERFFHKLGLRKRGQIIWKLSYQFVSSKWRRASDLCGIGKYGEDAYRIFCLGHTDLDPGDRYLRLYLDWLRANTDFLEEHSIVDSEYLIKDPILKYYMITLRDT